MDDSGIPAIDGHGHGWANAGHGQARSDALARDAVAASTVGADALRRIVEISILNPTWGYHVLSDRLKGEGYALGAHAVREILAQHALAQRSERLERLEDLYHREALDLTLRQARLLEKVNPCFRERFMESSRPGEVLAQESFHVGRFEGIGNVYLHSVVDTFNSFALAAVHPTKRAECAIALLRDSVLPFYAARGLTVGAVVTDNGREFCGTQAHQFAIFLAERRIEHYKAETGRASINGFVERFQRTVLVEFFSLPPRQRRYDRIDQLQAELAEWLQHYNYERRHVGYRNFGKPPGDLLR